MSVMTMGQALPRRGWLAEPGFDIPFIAGTAALALAAGIAATLAPPLFWPILLADLWLLGYHHVIATYTRLAFDRRSLTHHRLLVFALPPVVFAATATLGIAGGIGAIATLYFYWQWFHYTRQSWGVARAYGRKARDGAADPATDPCAGRLFTAAFYTLPLWGLLYRSAMAPPRFLGMTFRAVPVPLWLADAAGVAAVLVIVAWLVRVVRLTRAGHGLTLAQGLYLASHAVVFTTAYVVLDDINVGWLVVNVWHNAQYVLYVWLYNRRRFRDGPDPSARLLSAISQPGRMWLYMLVCLAVTTVLYGVVTGVLRGAALWALPATMVVFQAVNFHHYVVDGIIWKGARRKVPEAQARRA